MPESTKLIFKETQKLIIYIMIPVIGIIPFLDTDGYGLGKLFGALAVVFFIITQLPGLIRRFGLIKTFGQWYKTIHYSRAQQGILMFMFGLAHYLGVFVAPAIRANQLPTPTEYSLAGMAVLAMTFALAITSNTQSKKLLKKWWNRLHKLVFLISWGIAIHLFFVIDLQKNGSLTSIVLLGIIAIIGLLQTTSLLYIATKKRNRTGNAR